MVMAARELLGDLERTDLMNLLGDPLPPRPNPDRSRPLPPADPPEKLQFVPKTVPSAE